MRVKVPSESEQRKAIEKLLSSTRYDGKEPRKDKDGMPRVAPEPDDPDDE